MAPGASWKQHLASVITSLRVAGTFACNDVDIETEVDVPLPELSVKAVGDIALPLKQAQAAKLLAKGEPAPYGKGSSTVLDPAVRKATQVDAARLKIKASWQSALQEITRKVAIALGVNAIADVQARLYKLLLYQPGGHFVAHRDTEKEPGMFATLVVQLPVEGGHTGGTLRVTHRGQTFEWDSAAVSRKGQLSYAAFYADCEHELTAVTSGLRMVLTYNLVRLTPGSPPRAPADDGSRREALTTAVHAWENAPFADRLVAIPLEHKYTKANLSISGLKGRDAAVVGLLAGCALLDVNLALVTKRIFGGANESCKRPRYGGGGWGGGGWGGGGWGGSGWGGWYDEGEDEDEESDGDDGSGSSEAPSMTDVIEESVDTAKWVRVSGRQVDLSRLSISLDKALLGGEELFKEGDKPDDYEYEGYTGNEGATVQYFYHRAVVVVWPRARGAAVACAAGFSIGLGFLEEALRKVIEAAEAVKLERAGVEAGDKARVTGGVKEVVNEVGNPEVKELQGEMGGKMREAAAVEEVMDEAEDCGDAVLEEDEEDEDEDGEEEGGEEEEEEEQSEGWEGLDRAGAGASGHRGAVAPLREAQQLLRGLLEVADKTPQRAFPGDAHSGLNAARALRVAVSGRVLGEVGERAAARFIKALAASEGLASTHVVQALAAAVAAATAAAPAPALEASVVALVERFHSHQFERCLQLAQEQAMPEALRARLAQTLMASSLSLASLARMRLPDMLLMARLVCEGGPAFTQHQAAFSTGVLARQDAQEVLRELLKDPTVARGVAAGGTGAGLVPLVEARIRRLEEEVASGPPKDGWEQPYAQIPGYPQIEAFLRGPEQSKTFGSGIFGGIWAARSFADRFFGRKKDQVGHSGTATYGGRGKTAWCTITKDKRAGEEAAKRYRAQLRELKHARSLLPSTAGKAPKAGGGSGGAPSSRSPASAGGGAVPGKAKPRTKAQQQSRVTSPAARPVSSAVAAAAGQQSGVSPATGGRSSGIMIDLTASD